MSLFENFPYTNLHQLNLDWLVAEMKKVEDTIQYGPVVSVNGLTGEVVLYQEANVRLPDVMNPTQTNWNIFRYLNGHIYGIEFDATGNVYQIQDQYRRKLLTWTDIPPESGVISVNGKYGVVRLYGSDIQTSGDDTKTVMESIYDLEDTDGELQDAIDELDTTVTGIQSSISTINNSIDDLDELTSTLQTISNAIKNSLAYVENTDIATHNMSAGTYVLWNNGAYKVKAGTNIAIGDTLSSSNLNPIGTKGFINDLNDSMSALNSKTSHLYVVSNTVNSLANLVTLVKTYSNNDNIRANVDSSVVNALSNSTTTFDGIVDIIKVSANNCYYHVFNNQVMAYGNLQLSTGNVNIINDLNSKITTLENPSLNSNSVDISGYTSTYYTCPTDGYAWARNDSGVSGTVRIYGSSGSQYVPIGSTQGDFCAYVKKGMRLRVNGTLTNAEFIPFTT